MSRQTVTPGDDKMDRGQGSLVMLRSDSVTRKIWTNKERLKERGGRATRDERRRLSEVYHMK